MHKKRAARTSKMWIVVVVSLLACLVSARASLALDPKPTAQYAEWGGETWGELQVSPAITRSANSVTARAIVRGGPAGNPSWHCSEYSGWVAAGTSAIYIIIPEDWSFTSGEGFIRSIGGRAMGQETSAGDPPPYGWEDRLSDTCYCSVGTFGASGGCETREVVPEFASTFQQEILSPGPSGKWVRIQAEFSGWNGVPHSDSATAYVFVIDESEELDEDDDDDGMYDGWEIAHFGDLTTADATSSYDDGDGIDDLTEFNKWNSSTLDADGAQYDPTAQNTEGGSPDGGGGGSRSAPAPACGGAGPFTILITPVSLTARGLVTRCRRRHRTTPC